MKSKITIQGLVEELRWPHMFLIAVALVMLELAWILPKDAFETNQTETIEPMIDVPSIIEELTGEAYVGSGVIHASPFGDSLETAKAIQCVALTTFLEAGIASAEDQRDVAVTIINRALNERWADHPCDVVLERKQFQPFAKKRNRELIHAIKGGDLHANIDFLGIQSEERKFDRIYDMVNALVHRMEELPEIYHFWSPNAMPPSAPTPVFVGNYKLVRVSTHFEFYGG